jgi:septum formation protein
VAQEIILASGSPHRRALLRNAGLEFSAQKPDIDERAVEAALASGLRTADLGGTTSTTAFGDAVLQAINMEA